jgi:hypothetical protein
MSEPITNLPEAVAALGALPMPVGPELRTLDIVEEELTGANLALYEEELENARLRLALKSAQRGRRDLRSEVQFLEPSRARWRKACIDAEGERDLLKARVAELKADRADEHDELALALGRSNGTEWGDLIEFAAGAVSVEAKLRSRVAELEAERHSTNEALDDAVQELRRRESPAPYTPGPEVHAQMRRFGMRHCSNAKNGACENCGSLPESWCPDCAACERGCFGGFTDNPCTHSNARWGKSSRPASWEDPHDGPLAHPYRVSHNRQDMYETGGAS